jgi:histidinol dehydrogenase
LPVETLTSLPAVSFRTIWKAVEVNAWVEGRKSSLEDVREAVTGIIERVQNEGDDALRALAKKHCDLTDIAVSGYCCL